MNKASGAGNAIGKIIAYILVVLLVLGLAGVVVYFVTKDEGISFYVDFNGERYYSGISEADLLLADGETYSFSVKSLTGNSVDYSVSVSSNSERNFAFVYNGEFEDFYVKDDTENNDYSAVFDLQKSEGSFSITIPKDFTVEQAVKLKYGGDVQLQEELKFGYPYFLITVVSDENIVNLWLSFGMRLSLDSSQIVF